jgi:YVTN family beta-propeller protein
VATLEVGPTPQHITFAYKEMLGPLAYVVVQKANEVVVVNADPNALRIVDRIPVGQSPSGITANPKGTRLYVSNQRDDSVSVIDTSSSRVIATIPVGLHPIGLLAAD